MELTSFKNSKHKALLKLFNEISYLTINPLWGKLDFAFKSLLPLKVKNNCVSKTRISIFKIKSALVVFSFNFFINPQRLTTFLQIVNIFHFNIVSLSKNWYISISVSFIVCSWSINCLRSLINIYILRISFNVLNKKRS